MQADNEEMVLRAGGSICCAVALKHKLVHILQFVIASKACEQKNKEDGDQSLRGLHHS